MARQSDVVVITSHPAEDVAESVCSVMVVVESFCDEQPVAVMIATIASSESFICVSYFGKYPR